MEGLETDSVEVFIFHWNTVDYREVGITEDHT